MTRTEYSGGSPRLEAFRSLSQQTGAELRSVVALARHDKLGILFDANHILRRIDPKNAAVARRYLRDVRRRWEQREAASAQSENREYGPWVLRQCSRCGFGHSGGPPAGGGTSTCQRCGSDLAPDASTRDWPTVPVDGGLP